MAPLCRKFSPEGPRAADKYSVKITDKKKRASLEARFFMNKVLVLNLEVCPNPHGRRCQNHNKDHGKEEQNHWYSKLRWQCARFLFSL